MKNSNFNNHIKISAAAKEAGITKHTLENWVKLFGWQVHRNEQQHRLFSPDVVNQAKAVKEHLNKGGDLKELIPQAKPVFDSPARTQHVMERAPVYEPVL